MRFKKLPARQAAFTLLELIIVIAVLAIISAYVFTRPDTADQYQQDTVVEQLISSGRLTQQLSMNDSARNFTLAISANQIDILVDGVSFNSGTLSYPLAIDTTITLSPSVNISFNSIGETSATTISVQGVTTEQVCFDASGIIHQC